MKTNPVFFLLFLFLLFTACQGSDAYQGQWHATDRSGEKYTIDFTEHFFTVIDAHGDSVAHPYSQYSFNYEDGVTTFGIKLGDGRAYRIFFPLKNDTTKALIQLEDQETHYTICRDSFLRYEDIYDLSH